MSTIKDNIRRIAETEELKKLIAELLNEGEVGDKPSLGERRYAARLSSGGGISGSSTGIPDNDVGSLDPIIQNTDAALDSAINDILNEFGEAIDAGDFSSDIQDIFDNGLTLGDTIKELTNLEDGSYTGLIRFDDWTPPDIGGLDDYTTSDWTNGNDPRESQWESGTYYEFTVLTTNRSSNPYGAIEAGLAEYDSNDPPNAPHTLLSLEDYDVTTEIDGGTIEAIISRQSGTFPANVTIRKTGCTVGVDAHCPSSQPVNDWPSDDLHSLKFDGAQFQTNDYEADADKSPSWDNNPSKISATTSGGDSMSFEATKTGGLIINIDSGAASGTSYVTDSRGKVIDVVTDATKYKP